MKKTITILALTLFIITAFGVTASAADATEVRIPVTLSYSQSIASVAIGVEYSSGLNLKRIDKAAGIGAEDLEGVPEELPNPSGSSIKYYAYMNGSNSVTPSNGRITVGTLVFEYTADAPQSFTVVDAHAGWYGTGDNSKVAYGVLFSDVKVNISRTSGGAKADPATITLVVKPSGTGNNNTTGGSSLGGGGGGGSSTTTITETGSPLTGGAITGGAISTKPGFTDVDSVEWAWEAIKYMSENKGILGVGNNMFDPYGNVTRAQFSRFIAQAFDIGAGENPQSFTDVPAGAWFYEDVSKLASNNLILGYGTGLFGPDDSISREQMTTIVKRTLDYLGISVTAVRSFDIEDLIVADAYAQDSIIALYNAGIVNGMGFNYFVPKGTANRAQACTIVYQSLKLTGRL